jgi:hypothetical protein
MTAPLCENLLYLCECHPTSKAASSGVRLDETKSPVGKLCDDARGLLKGAQAIDAAPLFAASDKLQPEPPGR